MRKMVFVSLLVSSALLYGVAQQQQTGGTQTSGGTVFEGGGTPPGDSTQIAAGSSLIVIDTTEPGNYLAAADGVGLLDGIGFDGVGLYTLVDDSMQPLPCNAECLQAWPPYTSEVTISEDSPLDPSLIGTTQTEDGQNQVTYNGYPLYYYGEERSPGVLTGQAQEGFGGTWYVVSGDTPYEPLESDPILDTGTDDE